MRKWESLTDGDDPSQVDPPFEKTATWNVADGTQGLNTMPIHMAQARAQDMEYAYEAYTSGKKKPAASGGTTNDWELDEYYVRLIDLSRHQEISPELKEQVEARRKEVLKLRYP